MSLSRGAVWCCNFFELTVRVLSSPNNIIRRFILFHVLLSPYIVFITCILKWIVIESLVYFHRSRHNIYFSIQIVYVCFSKHYVALFVPVYLTSVEISGNLLDQNARGCAHYYLFDTDFWSMWNICLSLCFPSRNIPIS